VKDGEGKSFLFRNWKTCFEILDADGSGEVSVDEFQTLGFLFNFSSTAIKRIYEEFHIAGRRELDQSDFQLFVLAAMELQDKFDKSLNLEQESSSYWETWKEYWSSIFKWMVF
jgi:Ca2+-binding EF-hand superfamily protein